MNSKLQNTGPASRQGACWVKNFDDQIHYLTTFRECPPLIVRTRWPRRFLGERND